MAPTNTEGQEQVGGPQTPLGSRSEASGSDSGGGSQVFTHQVEHTGVVCDNCNSTINGFRYKCCQCRDFDLCSACERRGLHAGHAMLRIAFPEQANDAIRNYILKSSASRCPPPPVAPFQLGFAGVSDHDRKRHCKRERHSACHESPDSSDEAQFPWGPGCPVMMGKKEIKKWAKCMRKTAHKHKRSAFQAAGVAGQGQAESAATEENTEQTPPAPTAAFDFTAAASQIQEFLNAFGVPIDVVELYDEWGNRGTPNSGANQETSNSDEENKQGEKNVGASASSSGSVNQQTGLAEDLQKLNLGAENSSTVAGAERNIGNRNASPGATGALGMDVEGEAGWTLLEADKSNGVQSSDDVGNSRVDAAPVAEPTPVVVGVGEPASTNGASATTMINTPVTTTTNVGANNEPPRLLYPQLAPHLQQVVSDISNTVGNVVRNIPIVPWNQQNTNGTVFTRPPQQQTEGRGSAAVSNSDTNQIQQPELNDRMQMTLNQLLSMGFSNHDGWLARLVTSKNGNLEEVLNELFPVGNSNSSA